MPTDLSLGLAREIVTDLARKDNVRLVWGDASERVALMHGFAAVHWLRAALQGRDRPSWDVDAAKTYTSVTLPGAGWLASLAGQALAQVPVVGGLLASVIATSADDRVYVAPAATADPTGRALLAAWSHEWGHVRQMRRGNALAWCIAYGSIAPFRAGMDAPCIGQGLQTAFVLGEPLTEGAAKRRAQLPAYDLDGEDLALAVQLLAITERSLDQAEPGLLGGPSLDVLRAAHDAGVTLALDVSA